MSIQPTPLEFLQAQVPMAMACGCGMAPMAPMQGAFQPTADPISSFCSRWALTDQSRQFLMQLPQDVIKRRAAVMVVAGQSP